jgi:hypothetical protein
MAETSERPMNYALRDRLVALGDENEAAALSSTRASEGVRSLRGRFLFETDSVDWPPAVNDAMRVMERHASQLAEILEEHGWPGTDAVGIEASRAAWLIAQHADVALQRRCIPLLREAVQAGRADPEHLAALIDRVELVEGRSQQFGTHLRLDEQGRHLPFRGVHQPDRLDRRRLDLGLASWHDYVVSLGGTPGQVDWR